ncbi:MAG: deoxyribodipyrimidine photo-lyase, partial [Pseudomonadota bacterium]
MTCVAGDYLSPAMMTDPVTLVWLRRDLRLRDNLALNAAAVHGAVAPVFILDPIIDAQLGAAARLRLRMSLEALSRDLSERGLSLTLRRGEALETLREAREARGADGHGVFERLP